MKNKKLRFFITILVIAVVIIVTLYYSSHLLSTYFDQIANWIYPNSDESRGESIKILINLVGGFLVLYGLYISLRRAKAMESNVENQAEQLDLLWKSQIDERFKNAIEHLGSDKEPIILGGIAELHQIALENKEEYSEIIFNILTSYLRSKLNRREKLFFSQTAIQIIINYLFKDASNENYPYHGLKANLENCDFRRFNLDNCSLKESTISNCLLQRIQNSSLVGSKINSTVFGFGEIKNIDFSDVEFDNVLFQMTSIENSNLTDTEMISCYFLNTTISKTDFNSKKIGGVSFFGGRLSNLEFSTKELQEISIYGIELKGVSFNNENWHHFEFRACLFDEVLLNVKDFLFVVFKGCSNRTIVDSSSPKDFKHLLETSIDKPIDDLDFFQSEYGKETCSFNKFNADDYTNTIEEYNQVKEQIWWK